jgi:hypothetical protein
LALTKVEKRKLVKKNRHKRVLELAIVILIKVCNMGILLVSDAFPRERRNEFIENCGCEK